MTEPSGPVPSHEADVALSALGPLLDRLEELLEAIENVPEEVRDRAFELLDGVDAVHRLAIVRLARALGPETLRLLRAQDAAIGWLFEAYGVSVGSVQDADTALDGVRPYLHEHGGEVRVLAVTDGVVRVQLMGACSGCTSASATLRHGVEEALRENLPGFVAMDVAPADGAPAHRPPDSVLVQITARPQ